MWKKPSGNAEMFAVHWKRTGGEQPLLISQSHQKWHKSASSSLEVCSYKFCTQLTETMYCAMCTSLHNWPFHSHQTRARSLPFPLFPLVLRILSPLCIMILLFIDINFIWLSMMFLFLCHGYTFDLPNKQNLTCAKSFLKLRVEFSCIHLFILLYVALLRGFKVQE